MPMFFRLNPSRIALSTAALCLSGSIAHAGSPRVTHTYPAGGQRGSEIEITCSGSNLADAKSLMFDTPGFETTAVTAEKGKFKVKVKVAPEVQLGEHTFRAVTASGISDLRLFYVSPFPMVEELESKDAPAKAQTVPLGATIYGRTQTDDQDQFEVELKKGQRLTAEVIGARLQTQQLYDPHLLISKADGTPLGEFDDCALTRQDPVASVMVPEDGKYVLTVRDSTNSGLGECHYLLNIGSFARPVAVYPPGGPAGEEMKVKLIGDAAGVIEKTVKLPAEPDERFPLFSEGDQPTPQPNYLRVSQFPNVLEAEPNNDIKTSTDAVLAAPVALNGIIQEKGDVDCFKFKAVKDAQVDISVYARRLRSPLDSIFDIYDAKGARLGGNDDSGSSDSYVRWKAPADGEYHLTIRDHLFRGGPNFTYRIELTGIQPKITNWLPEMVQNSNQERRAFVVPKGNRYASLVRVKRADVAGDIQMEPVDLPPGLNVSAPIMDKSVDTIPMIMEAAPDAAETAKTFVMKAKLTEPPKDTVVLSAVEHELDVAENGNQKSFYAVKEDRLPVEITSEIPVKISLVQPMVPVLQTGSLNLKVVAERKNDFKGAISLALLHTPPGLGTAGSAQIKENENEGIVTVSANGNAPLQKWKLCVIGSADFGQGTVWFSTQLVEVQVAAPFTSGKIARTFVDQGDSTTVTVQLESKAPFEGKAKLQLVGLPPNTTADEQEISTETKEVKFTVKAEKNAPAGQHKQLFCQFSLTKDGEPMTSTFANGGILRIDKAAVAKNEEPKK